MPTFQKLAIRYARNGEEIADIEDRPGIILAKERGRGVGLTRFAGQLNSMPQYLRKCLQLVSAVLLHRHAPPLGPHPKACAAPLSEAPGPLGCPTRS